VFSRRAPAALRFGLSALLCALSAVPSRGLAQAVQASPTVSEAPTGQWYIGAYYRHAWVPSFMLKPIFERAASISNEGLGMVLSHASRDGLTVQVGLGYQGYHFQGAFNPNDAIVEDTEWVKSELGLVHLTGSLLWPIRLHRKWTIELGVGVDLGIVTGQLHRTEAYPRDGLFQPCEAAGQPDITGPSDDARGNPQAYCEQAYDRNGDEIDTSGATVSGAHYNDRETRVPPLMLVPMLPHAAVRFEPIERIAIKLEGAFGLAQFWLGASVHVGLGHKTRYVEPEPVRTVQDVEAEPPPANVPIAPVAAPVVATTGSPKLGRVIGKLMEESTSKPIAHGSVKNRRMFSAIQTDDAGLFVFENVEPGSLRLDVSHPDYEPAGCDATIPPEGGDLNVHCFLRPGRKEGAISGHVKDQDGKPVGGVRIEISGPLNRAVQSDSGGLFALVDAPEGTYRLRIQAPGYLLQIIELELGARETAMPQIILLRSSESVPREAKP
jgi:hypothetical protein